MLRPVNSKSISKIPESNLNIKLLHLRFCILLFLSINTAAFSQSSINRFLTPADSINKQRAITVVASWTLIYTGTLIGLNQVWYSQYPHSSFHFFNDNNEWLQMDKVGHVYTGYFESVWSTHAFEWAGIKRKKAAWIGGATGFVLQSSLEVMDGFSEKWGASAADLIANAAGSAICISQQLLWDEQRIQIKFSVHPVKYTPDLKARQEDLFGNSFAEKIFKDYNGQTYWLSANPSSFINNDDSKFPRWLNISVGYGAAGMLGGFENKWIADGEVTERFDIPRTRQYYLSADIDLTRIKTNSALLKTFFDLANIIKIPAPALELNSDGKLKFYPLYF
jgi:hypothetical protein